MSSQSENILSRYLPENSLEAVMKILRSEKVEIRIKDRRSSKFGDYRFPGANGRHRISINADLNAYAFLITLLHEMAHLKAFKHYGRQIKPHGAEWQEEFRLISAPFIEQGIFPKDVAVALSHSLRKGHSSSCTDLSLYRNLKQYDQKPAIHVEDLPVGSLFELNSMVFRKGEKARKRYKCLNTSNGREYMVHALAEVKTIETERKNKSA